MKILITGGTGFIGSHVTEQLAEENHHLLLVSKRAKNLPFDLGKLQGADHICCDLSNLQACRAEIRNFKPEAAVHLAWEGIPNYDARTSTRNLHHGLNLITMLSELGCQRLICTGSCWEYANKSGALREDAVVLPTNPFTAAKTSLHWMGKEIARERGMMFLWLRLFYVFGPRQKQTSLIPHIISCVRQGRHPQIKTPLVKNDFVYAKDVAGAISSILHHQTDYDVFNIGSGQSHSVQHMMHLVCQAFDKECPAETQPEKDAPPPVDFWADISKIKQSAGWEPKFSVEQAIRETAHSASSFDQGA